MHAELESRELLALCLKHVKGMKREHQLVNALFIWTEPHSKELKVKLVLQQEVAANVVMQQSVIVEYRIDNRQCFDCKKTFTKHTWESSVQVRQRVEHRRTLLNLERVILKHGAHKQLIKVEQAKDGMDFFFTRERDAQEFVAFIKSWAIVKVHDSKHLVSHNQANTTYRFKRSTCIEICPVCRDDLVFLPPKTAQALGGLPPVMLCTHAVSVIGLVDPATSRTVEISASEYWKRPFTAMCTASHLKEFVVLDVNAEDAHSSLAGTRGRPRCGVTHCEVEVARASDFGQNDDRLLVNSHLGNILHPGDVALGFDLRTTNHTIDEAEMGSVPPLEVYLVRKQRPPKLQAPKSRRGGISDVASQFTAPTLNLGNAEPSVAAVDETGTLDDDDEEDCEAQALEVAAAKMLDSLGQEKVPDGTQLGEAGVELGIAAISGIGVEEACECPQSLSGDVGAGVEADPAAPLVPSSICFEDGRQDPSQVEMASDEDSGDLTRGGRSGRQRPSKGRTRKR